MSGVSSTGERMLQTGDFSLFNVNCFFTTTPFFSAAFFLLACGGSQPLSFYLPCLCALALSAALAPAFARAHVFQRWLAEDEGVRKVPCLEALHAQAGEALVCSMASAADQYTLGSRPACTA